MRKILVRSVRDGIGYGEDHYGWPVQFQKDPVVMSNLQLETIAAESDEELPTIYVKANELV